MSTERCHNDPDRDELVESLEDNIGRVITVFTQSGGCSGRGFTGLLASVNDDTIKLITAFSSAPRSPFGRSDFDDFGFNPHCRCRHGSRFGTAIIIPINKIVSVVFNEL